MTGYAILNKKESLKLLCFRGGFFIKKIVILRENISGKSIVGHIEKELELSNIDLGIVENQKYKFYEVELAPLPLYLRNFFNLIRHFIGGSLITWEGD
ncbi:hypothetical protein [Psychrilyobacter atlanticus]|uniref:hypothetical protein n=1 Tax=Psychrilyobacter atlanticus TaxID=271091 RepID=UPI0003FF1DEB|nr:hypothetical protein [Psychrilyobacter atlanticus]